MTPVEINQEQLDQILLAEGSLKKLKPFFPNQEAILSYHASRISKIFPSDRKIYECEHCHRHSAELRIVFEWRGIYHTAGTAGTSMVGILIAMTMAHHFFHFLMPQRQIDFVTTHGLCSNCFAQIKRRRVLASLFKQLCLVLIAISIVIFAAVAVFTMLFVFSEPTTGSIGYVALGLFGGLLFLVGGLWGTDRSVRWCLPKSLKFISKAPFELIGFLNTANTTARIL